MAMPAPVLLDEARRRKADKRSAGDELQMEIAAHAAEALALVALCRPLVSRLVMATQHIGPTAHQTAVALDAALTRYERRHLEPTGDAA